MGTVPFSLRNNLSSEKSSLSTFLFSHLYNIYSILNSDKAISLYKNKEGMEETREFFVKKKALAVEAPRFGKGSGAKEDPLQPAYYILYSTTL